MVQEICQEVHSLCPDDILCQNDGIRVQFAITLSCRS